MSALSDSMLNWFFNGEAWKPPTLQWVKVIRSTSYEEIVMDRILNDDLNWIDLDEPLIWSIPETWFCVVCDYGEGPHGYFVSTEARQAESVAQAIRENRLQDVVTFS